MAALSEVTHLLGLVAQLHLRLKLFGKRTLLFQNLLVFLRQVIVVSPDLLKFIGHHSELVVLLLQCLFSISNLQKWLHLYKHTTTYAFASDE